MEKNLKAPKLVSDKERLSGNKKSKLSESLRENLKKRKIQAKNRKHYNRGS